MTTRTLAVGFALLALSACNGTANNVLPATNGPTNPIDGTWTLAALNCSATGNQTPTGTTTLTVTGASGSLANIQGGCTLTDTQSFAYTTSTVSVQTTANDCNPSSCDPACGTFSNATQTFGYTVTATHLTLTRQVPSGGTECPVGETSTWTFIK